jgi:plastocyanin
MRSLRPAKLSAVAALASAALAPAGCGHLHTVRPAGVLRVGLSEYRLTPANVHASPGALTVVAHNFGRLVHNLEVLRNGKLAAATRPIRPGSSARLELTVTGGTYVLASGLFQDESLGMRGTLKVG